MYNRFDQHLAGFIGHSFGDCFVRTEEHCKIYLQVSDFLL